MARPVLNPPAGRAVDDFYDALPEHYREADEPLGYPLYRWMAGPLSQLGVVTTLIDRFTYDPAIPEDGTTSDLTDPETADPEWLPWLAQLVGVPLPAGLSTAEARDAVRFASAGWRAGTKASIAAAARTALTGSQFARVFDHSISDPGNGGPFDVMVVTVSSETPSSAAVLDAIVRRGAKPAGVVLHHRDYESSWDAIATNLGTTWADVAGPWNRIMEAGL